MVQGSRVSADHINALSNRVIGGCIEVHRHLGPGLLESVYEACVCRELTELAIPFECQKPLPVYYKGEQVDCGYRLDIFVDECLILELKCVEQLLPIHTAQLMTYLRLSNTKLGLLVNFNVPILKQGIKRVVNGLPNRSPSRSSRLSGESDRMVK
jgi:GxxExxY protein